jgi:hypothetical protein
MDHANPPLEALDASELAAVTGGGLLGAAWHVIDGGYHVAKDAYRAVKPVIKELSPFGSVAYRARSIWHKLTK